MSSRQNFDHLMRLPYLKVAFPPPQAITCCQSLSSNLESLICIKNLITALLPSPLAPRVYTDVDSDVFKCRCRMSTGFPANVDGNVENISIYHGKKAQKTICWKNAESYVDIIYIYIYTHTNTHPQKGLFFKHFHEKKCKKLGSDSKKCQCRLKRPANVDDEYMSMSMVPPNVDPIWSTSVYTLTSWHQLRISEPKIIFFRKKAIRCVLRKVGGVDWLVGLVG